MAYDSQYNNGAPNGYGYQPGPAQTLEIKRREKRQIRKLGNISGLGILLFALFQFIDMLLERRSFFQRMAQVKPDNP